MPAGRLHRSGERPAVGGGAAFLSPAATGGPARIEALLPRRGRLARKGAGTSTAEQVVAANDDNSSNRIAESSPGAAAAGREAALRPGAEQGITQRAPAGPSGPAHALSPAKRDGSEMAGQASIGFAGSLPEKGGKGQVAAD